jgi:predicted nuclease with RNAse H fold
MGVENILVREAIRILPRGLQLIQHRGMKLYRQSNAALYKFDK